MISLTRSIVFNFMYETWSSAVAETPKRKSIGLLLDTQSYKQSQKKINTLQGSEQGSTEESGARAPRITDITVFSFFFFFIFVNDEYQIHCCSVRQR